MPPRLTQEEFISKCIKVHGTKYDYSEAVYRGNQGKVQITCEGGHRFLQVADTHLSGSGCRLCSIESNRKSNLQERKTHFLSSANKLHGEVYDYSKVEYLNDYSAVTLSCKIHGTFQQVPSSHLQGAGCKKCGYIKMGLQGRKSQEEFLSDCKEVHGDRYDYTKAEYLGDAKHVVIGCTNHGDFKSTPSNHLSGKGCPTCAIENGTTYNITLAERNKKDFLGLPSGVYVMALYGLGKESIYKIGITKDLKRRLKDIAREIGHPPTLLYYAPSNLYDSIITEQGLHDALSEFSYTSPIKFGGYTECFSLPDETATDLIEYLTYTFGEDTEIHE